MAHGWIFGPIEILAGIYLILSQFNVRIFNQLFGLKGELVIVFIILGCVLINFIMGMVSGENMIAEVAVNFLFALLPLIYVLNELVFPIIRLLPSVIPTYYLLFMGIVSIINGIINFF